MKRSQLNLIIFCLLSIFFSPLNATNPVSIKAFTDYHQTSELTQTNIQKKQKFKKLKRWFQKAKSYLVAQMSKSMKFLFAWLGLGLGSILFLILGYAVVIIFGTTAAVIAYFVFLLLAFFAGIASSVFFILWLVEYIRETSTGTQVPGPEVEEERREPQQDRKRRKKRKRN